MPDPTAVAAAVSTWPGLLAFVAAMLLPHVFTYVQGRRTRRDTRVIREQTENNHANAPHPNMREQLDAMHADIRTAASKADQAAKVAADTQTALTDHVTSDEAWKTSVEGDLARRRRPLLSWRY